MLPKMLGGDTFGKETSKPLKQLWWWGSEGGAIYYVTIDTSFTGCIGAGGVGYEHPRKKIQRQPSLCRGERRRRGDPLSPQRVPKPQRGALRERTDSSEPGGEAGGGDGAPSRCGTSGRPCLPPWNPRGALFTRSAP